jgi:putative spermidine/putrescine transport system permease protein
MASGQVDDMTTATGQPVVSDSVMRTADGTPLKVKLRQSLRREQLKALGLIAPLFLFIVLSFLIPILTMLTNAIYDPDVHENMPQTVALLQAWDGKDVPNEETFAAFAADLKSAHRSKLAALIGKRLNYEVPTLKSKVTITARKLDKIETGPWKEAVLAIDPIWGDVNVWGTIKRASNTYTPFYLLNVLDLKQGVTGGIEPVDPDRAIYRQILVRTLMISFSVTLLTLALGYPVAFMLATLPQRTASLLMILVLLPFWTSLLVRTTAWSILLQDGGVVTQFMSISGLTWLLNSLGLMTGEPHLYKTRIATILAMTHIQLPFTLLPIYSVMKTISPNYMRAARSLGAKPAYAFVRVYMPQTLPGVAAGCLLTFILCLGYYITPALVGGPADNMVSGFIDSAMNSENNWGKASALGAVLLTATLILYYVYNRLVGIDKIKLG